MPQPDQLSDARTEHHIIVNVTETFTVTPNGSRRKANHNLFPVMVDERDIGRCERAMRLINNNQVRVGKRHSLRCDTPRRQGLNGRDLTVSCSVWIFTSHQDAVVNAELHQLVRTLIDKLATMGEKHRAPQFLRSKLYDLCCDDCLTGTCRGHDQNLAVSRPDRLAHLLDAKLLVVAKNEH